MPIKANFNTIITYPHQKEGIERNTQNLLGVNGKKEYNGYLSLSTKRKIKKLITNLAASLKYTQANGEQLSVIPKEQRTKVQRAVTNFHKSGREGAGTRKLSMVTLTLPAKQIHTDKEIKREALNLFLTKITKECDIRLWLWVAEAQTNGNIHFHIIIDNYIPYVVADKAGKVIFSGSYYKCCQFAKGISNKVAFCQSYAAYEWNRAIGKMGYIEEFKRKHGHTNPPTTHIELIKNEKAAARYLSKYITKADDNTSKKERKIEGRLWGCSDELKKFENVDIPKRVFNKSLAEIIDKGKLVVNDEFVKVWILEIIEIPSIFELVYKVFAEITIQVYEFPSG